MGDFLIEIFIKEQKYLNDLTNEIITIPEVKLQLEHSLLSVKKWESKWHKSFLSEEKTETEMIDYIRCMEINKNIPKIIYDFMPFYVIEKVADYIKDPMTATTFSNTEDRLLSGMKNIKITSEIIYYWMISLNIPVEFEKWHLNQLLTLIKVINVKNAPKQKINKREAARRRAKLNAERRAALNSKG